MSSYWKQWDAEDLESWQGIERVNDTHKDNDEEAIKDQTLDQQISNGIMYDLGLTWSMFL